MRFLQTATNGRVNKDRTRTPAPCRIKNCPRKQEPACRAWPGIFVLRKMADCKECWRNRKRRPDEDPVYDWNTEVIVSVWIMKET